jgi:hypothetical protein
LRLVPPILVGFLTVTMCLGQTVVRDTTVLSTAVSELFTGDCDWAVRVWSPDGFTVGDRVILYQAKGATCAQRLPSDTGNITDEGLAGVFEFNWIRRISGTKVFLRDSIKTPFELHHQVQLIKVIRAEVLILSGVVRPLPWNGAYGGVVAIEAPAAIQFIGGHVSASAAGFRGGEMSSVDTSCTVATAMHTGWPSTRYGSKGEGLAQTLIDAEAGRASLANGGGGGGNHNSGGGGGACAGAGGRGGSRWSGCTGTLSTYGLGGWPTVLDPAVPRMPMGGGGGGGHHDEDGLGTNGGRGGGAVLLRSPMIDLRDSDRISADGETVADTARYNGAGGGGAGGTILLVCDSFSSSGRISARGGRGGHVAAGQPEAHGPGGGGGGGYIATSMSAMTPLVQVGAGLSGLNLGHVGITSAWYAEPGSPGRVVTGVAMTTTSVETGPDLFSDGDLDLGTLNLGSTVQTTFHVMNRGSQAALITGIFFNEGHLREVSAQPQPPVVLRPGDTLTVIAEGTVDGGEQADFLVLDVNNVCGVIPTVVAARWWRTFVDTTCKATVRLQPSAASSGRVASVDVTIDQAQNIPETDFRFAIQADRHVLHLRTATIRSAPGVSASIADYREAGDTAILIVTGNVRDATDLDTVVSIDVLVLFSADSSTDISFTDAESFSWSRPCEVQVQGAFIEVSDVCGSRGIRLVTFHGENSALSSWTLYDLRGVVIRTGHMNESPLHDELAQGAYILVHHTVEGMRTELLLKQ